MYEISVNENVLLPTSGGSLRLSCKLWTVKGKEAFQHQYRFICYPGWLDNAGSFDNCAEILCKQYGFALLCVDPPGCGLSDHKPKSSLYNDYEEAPLIADLADTLGWKEFGILAHSRGGGVATLATAFLKERVKVFVAIDSYFTLSGLWFKDLISPVKAPARMKQAWENANKNYDRKPRTFDSFEEAVHVNKSNPIFLKSESTARNIVRRHLRVGENGKYTFTHDVRTYGQMQFLHLSYRQAEEFVSAITCPVLQVLDRTRLGQSFSESFKKLQSLSSLISDITVIEMNGKGHHLHSDHPQEFSNIVGPWILKNYGKSQVKKCATLPVSQEQSRL